jgi:hypothetical protein
MTAGGKKSEQTKKSGRVLFRMKKAEETAFLWYYIRQERKPCRNWRGKGTAG